MLIDQAATIHDQAMQLIDFPVTAVTVIIPWFNYHLQFHSYIHMHRLFASL
jgi:hypothetical protein